MLKNTFLTAAFACLLMACNEPTPTAEDDDSVTAIPDKNYTPPAIEDTSNNATPAQPTSDMAQIAAQDTMFEDGSIPTKWGNAGFDNPADFKNFIVQFKDWVKNDNTDSIAAHINFPIKAAKTAAIFKEKYTDIFTDKLKEAVAGQRLDRIFRNSDGAMVGSGQIWFTTVKGNYVITAINKGN